VEQRERAVVSLKHDIKVVETRITRVVARRELLLRRRTQNRRSALADTLPIGQRVFVGWVLGPV
jgi:hypothetical protein